MRQGRVFCNGIAAGIITEDEQGYTFVYDEAYLGLPDARPVSLTLPLRQEPYVNNVMFSFFDGLIPEGWMLNIAERTGKLIVVTGWHCCLPAVATVSVTSVLNPSISRRNAYDRRKQSQKMPMLLSVST